MRTKTAKKRRTHKLADQHPLGAAFAALAVCFVVFIVLAMVFDAICSSVVFGLAHGMNGLVGADPGRTVMQIFEAGLIGMFLAALYLRSGSLWPPIIIHAVNDIVALMNVTEIAETGLIQASINAWTWIDFGACIVLAIIALYLIRPAKRAEIIEIFNEKWRGAWVETAADQTE